MPSALKFLTFASGDFFQSLTQFRYYSRAAVFQFLPLLAHKRLILADLAPPKKQGPLLRSVFPAEMDRVPYAGPQRAFFDILSELGPKMDLARLQSLICAWRSRYPLMCVYFRWSVLSSAGLTMPVLFKVGTGRSSARSKRWPLPASLSSPESVPIPRHFPHSLRMHADCRTAHTDRALFDHRRRETVLVAVIRFRPRTFRSSNPIARISYSACCSRSRMLFCALVVDYITCNVSLSQHVI